jgi:hypothetical protein
MSIKDAYRHGALITTKLSKEGCILLIARRRIFRVARRHDLRKCGPPST